METWREELYHHGVMGMKWGVRRYQPYSNGTRKRRTSRFGADNATAIVKRSRSEKKQKFEHDLVNHRAASRSAKIMLGHATAIGATITAGMLGGPAGAAIASKALLATNTVAFGAHITNMVVANSEHLAIDAKYLNR